MKDTKRAHSKVIVLSIAVLITSGLPGCGSAPKKLDGPEPDSMSALVAHPMLDQIDVGSFKGAVVMYPIAGAPGTPHHQVPVSDYLLAQTVDALSNSGIENNVRLSRFDVVCAMDSAFMSHAICNGEMIIAIEKNTMRATLTDYDVGNVQVIKGGPFSNQLDATRIVRGQAATLVDELVARLAQRIQVEGSQSDLDAEI